jgi:hypothetical protein
MKRVVLRARRFRGFALKPFPENVLRAVSVRGALSPFPAGTFRPTGLPAFEPALQVHSANSPGTSQRLELGVGACAMTVRAYPPPASSAGVSRTRRTSVAQLSHHRQEAFHGHFRHP